MSYDNKKFKTNILKFNKDILGLMPGEISSIPKYQLINSYHRASLNMYPIYHKVALNMYLMTANSYLNKRYIEQDLFIQNHLKSMISNNIIDEGNKLIKRMMERSINDRIEDDINYNIETSISDILGIEHMQRLRLSRRGMSFIYSYND